MRTETSYTGGAFDMTIPAEYSHEDYERDVIDSALFVLAMEFDEEAAFWLCVEKHESVEAFGRATAYLEREGRA